MSGEDVGRVLESGAAAAQMGTAFLCCDEAELLRLIGGFC